MKLSPEMTAKVLELAGEPAAKPRQPRRVKPVTAATLGLVSATLRLGCRVVSEMNQRGHWAERHRRFVMQKNHLIAVIYDWRQFPFAFPVCVTFVHVGRAMDDDNLAGSFKGLRDAFAEWVQVDDADPRITWKYEQRKGTPAGVEIRIETLGAK